MKNLAFILLIVGAALIGGGLQQHQIADGAEKDPVRVRLGALEKGAPLHPKYIIVGKHWKGYPYSVFEYKSLVGEDAGPSSRVRHSYYPVVSESHPVGATLAQLTQRYGSLRKVPEAEMPALSDYALLVRTTEFKRVSDLPTGWKKGAQLSGLIMNNYGHLSSEELKLLSDGFPEVDLRRMKVLDLGREPLQQDYVLMLLGGGAGTLVLSMVLFSWLIVRFFRR